MKNKTFGVCICLLTLGLVGLGAPASHARSRLAAGGSGEGSGTETTSTASSSTTPPASSSADLRQRIDALKAELADLNTQLAAEKDREPAGSTADVPQDQGSPAPTTPAQAAAPAATPAAPMPLPSPSMSGPLATSVPHEISAGPFGKLEVTGILSGMGWTEGNHISGDMPTHVDVSNAQVFVQKTTGWFQFYLQGGAYNIPALGTPFTRTVDTVTGLFGPLPTGYLKLVKGNFNVEIGELPTLIGAEYTFDFENMNIERGLLWNQENAISRGIQLNDTYKKLTLAFSWNDGFYSNHYNWLTGSAAWAFNASNTLSFVGGGNVSGNARNTAAVGGPVPLLQNNSMIFNLIYTYTHGNWIVSPYYQYTGVPKNATIGIGSSAHTNGGAVLVNYAFKHGFSLAARPEYIKSSGSVLDPNAINLMYGPGTGAFSFTLTPAYIKDGFFARGEFSIVSATNTTPTFAVFGPDGTKTNQPRGALEVGFMF
jgi:hypothetical protein